MEHPYRLLSATRNSMALAAPSAAECSSGSTRKAGVGIRLRANGKKKKVIWKPVPNRGDSL